jgi:succinate dehydrogenase / fumarate reductase, cytochrome b subunit
MAAMSKSTIGRKLLMALSAVFLIIFLVMHLSVNLISIFSENAFNEASHFMESNFFVQKIGQPILIVGVIYHFVMGFVLEIQNQKARPVKYAMSENSGNSTWMSRNMIISGAVILAFLALHFADFWIPTIAKNYFGVDHNETSFQHLQGKFVHLWRVIAYVICFVLLGLHLAHGFQSAFQSMGARHPKYTPCIKSAGNWYAVLIPLGFAVVAIFHFVSQ